MNLRAFELMCNNSGCMYFRTILIMKYFEKHSLMSLKTDSAARHSCSVKFHVFVPSCPVKFHVFPCCSSSLWRLCSSLASSHCSATISTITRTTIGNPYNLIYTKDEQKSLQCHVIQSVSFYTVTVFVVK